MKMWPILLTFPIDEEDRFVLSSDPTGSRRQETCDAPCPVKVPETQNQQFATLSGL